MHFVADSGSFPRTAAGAINFDPEQLRLPWLFVGGGDGSDPLLLGSVICLGGPAQPVHMDPNGPLLKSPKLP